MALMGLLVGFLVGLTGVGAAALITPVLMFMGIHPTVAVGTDLVYNSVTKLFGAAQHFRQKTIHFGLVKYLSYGSIPSAVLAILLLHLFPALSHDKDSIIKHVLGVALILVSLATFVRTFFDKKLKNNAFQQRPLEDKKLLAVGIGVVVGFLVGLTSVGSGALFSVALLYLFPLSASQVVGTDIAQAFLLTTVSGAINVGLGHVNYLLAGNLLIGSVPGVIVGSYLSTKVPARPLRAVIAAVMLVSGAKLI